MRFRLVFITVNKTKLVLNKFFLCVCVCEFYVCFSICLTFSGLVFVLINLTNCLRVCVCV